MGDLKIKKNYSYVGRLFENDYWINKRHGLIIVYIGWQIMYHIFYWNKLLRFYFKKEKLKLSTNTKENSSFSEIIQHFSCLHRIEERRTIIFTDASW
jgi:hypothetical protein